MTPHFGPLSVVKHSWEACSIVDGDGRTVATLKCWEDEGEENVDERALAMAKLFKAAPAMAEALLECVEVIEDEYGAGMNGAANRAREALREAGIE